MDDIFGVKLDLLSALPPWGARLPLDVDRAQLDEVECLVACAQEISRLDGIDCDVELDGEHIGRIDSGRLDQSLAQGFLEEWRRGLDARG